MRQFTKAGTITSLALFLSLTAVAPASADTIDYDINANAAYTVDKHGQGLVDVTYNGCVTAGVRTRLGFNVRTDVTTASQATFTVLRAEGENPVATFDPQTLSLTPGPEETASVVLGFTLTELTQNDVMFRFKLDPEEGEGQGQGAGVTVRIPCVVEATATPPGEAAPDQGTVAIPPVSKAAPRNARCIAVISRQGRRAGQLNRIRVRVRDNGLNVQGATVTLRGAGVSVRKRTTATGHVLFSVRPRRAGRLVIQSNVCEGRDRLRVLGAAARFTG